MDIPMKELVILNVASFINRKPNKVTKKALKQVKTGKGIKKFGSLKEMLEDLKS